MDEPRFGLGRLCSAPARTTPSLPKFSGLRTPDRMLFGMVVLGLARIVVSEILAPNMLVNLV